MMEFLSHYSCTLPVKTISVFFGSSSNAIVAHGLAL